MSWRGRQPSRMCLLYVLDAVKNTIKINKNIKLYTFILLRRKKINSLCKLLISLEFLVGRARFELATNGLKVRCSTD